MRGTMANQSSWQAVWANIWSAVLAVSLPAENCVFVWLCPEVLLSLLLKESDYTKNRNDLLGREDGGSLQRAAANLQIPIANQRGRVGFSRLDGLGLLRFQAFHQHAVEQTAELTG